MVAQMRAALQMSAELLTAVCGMQTAPVGSASPSVAAAASALGSGAGGDSKRLSGWDMLVRVMLAALGLTLIIGAGCFARWGPVPNRFSAGSGGDEAEADEEEANPTFEAEDSEK